MAYSLVGNRVVRDDGFVALQHYSTNGANVTVGETTYIFTPKNNVALCWIAPAHVDQLLALKTRGNCCGRSERLKFVLASFINCNLWTFNSREYPE